MPLATVQDWIAANAELRHVADLDGDGVPDEAEIARCLHEAETLIEGWTAKRYPQLPTKALPLLKLYALDLATLRLATTVDALTDSIEKRGRAAETYLMRVSDGEADLPGTADQAGGGSEDVGAEVRMEAPARVFGRDAMEGL